MADINCSHCGEPWDAWGLKNDSIGYLTDDQTPWLAPLGTAEDALTYIAGALGSGRAHDLRTALTAVINRGELDTSGQPATLPALATWWAEKGGYTDNHEARAVADIVQNAIFAGVANGQGCPSCGFDHSEIGPHREATLRQLVNDVDDTDPTPHLLYDEGRS